jgi:type IV pilus assembly protein PilO
MKKSKAVATEKASPIFDKLEQLTKVQRIAIWAGVMVLIIGGFIYFSYAPKYSRIDKLQVNLKKAESQLQVAKSNARQLNEYRKKMHDAEEQFKIVMRALPEKEEIPTLLTGISKAGKYSGLNFLLFQPKPEIKKEFYAEIPVAIRVSGDYHGMATFFESVAELNRIVNIKDITMKPEKEGQKLNTTCTAVTYKFIEASETKNKKPKSSRRRK